MTKIPPELEKRPLHRRLGSPNRPELNKVVEGLLHQFPQGCEPGIAKEAEGREQIVDAALGLTLTEAENVIAKSIVRHKTFRFADDSRREKTSSVRAASSNTTRRKKSSTASVVWKYSSSGWSSVVTRFVGSPRLRSAAAERIPAAGRAGLR